jgi:hypothetical protein
MHNINILFKELDDKNIARKVGNKHDNARIKFKIHSNTVKDYDEFSRIIGDYVRHHNSLCISKGGNMSQAEAVGLGREIIDQEYRRKGSDFIGAYNDAYDGINGGLRAVLDALAEGLKAISVGRFIRHTFDEFVCPNSWSQKLALTKSFIERYGAQLSSSIQVDRPERYAASYFELISHFLEGMRRTSSVFRRL